MTPNIYAINSSTLALQLVNLQSAQNNLLTVLTTKGSQQPQTGIAYTIANNSGLPVVITATDEHASIIYQQMSSAGQSTTIYGPLKNGVTLKVHANVPPAFFSCVARNSYSLTMINQNQLIITQLSTNEGQITNNSGWPMLIAFGNHTADYEYAMLEHEHTYQIPTTSLNFTVIPMIQNATKQDTSTNWSIKSSNGQLIL